MRVAFFDTHQFERSVFESVNKQFGFDLCFFDVRLNRQTAVLAKDFKVVCSFVNDSLDEETLGMLKSGGCKLIALRSAGYNHVNLSAANLLGLTVVRVPEYSPFAVAEHAVALLLTLNRKIHRSYQRVRELNFSLEGLVGMDLHGKTVGVIGTGKIGSAFARIMHGFGCNLLLFDISPNGNLASELNASYVTLEEIYQGAHAISLHVPLTPQTQYLINQKALTQMRHGVFLINTGRGALVNTKDLINQLKTGHIGGAALDVYEEEESIFFLDHSNEVLQDDTFARLLTFPNVIITSHQGFLTQEALGNIALTTLTNIQDFERQNPLKHQVTAPAN
ncbi:MAG: 2-hydroxyacid dehydrogenase [Proteobacteria bacterium]|nr:2-hydroxyacid dehydrogenase [Pseudomonadota bacterium]